MFDVELYDKAAAVLEHCRRHGLRVVTAESCSGGLIAACLTAIPGSSDVIDRGFVTYSNAAKEELLDVAPATLADHGAVSREVALAMAEGALAKSRADIAVAVTGIAGPAGGTPEKPIGLVQFACLRRGADAQLAHHIFAGDRDTVRRSTVLTALAMILTQAP